MTLCNCCSTKEEEPKPQYNTERGCTDTLCLLLFIGGWAAVIAIISAAGGAGANPVRIYHGTDYTGTICGYSSTLKNGATDTNNRAKDFIYAAWPDPTISSFMVCVRTCNVTYDPTFYAADILTPYTTATILQKVSGDPRPLAYHSTPFLNWCFPNPTQADSQDLANALENSEFSSTSAATSRAMNDLFTAFAMILVSAFIALAFAFVYLTFLKYCAGNLVVGFILILIVGGILMGVGLLQRAKEIKDSGVQEERAKALNAVGWIAVILTFLFICAVIFLWSRIKLAIEVVKQAGAAMRDMPWVAGFPLFPFLFACGYFVFWIATVIYIFSVSTTKQQQIPTAGLMASIGVSVEAGNANMTVYEFNEGFKNSMVFVFFHLLWQVQFLIYFTFFVIAGATANWYFAAWKDDRQEEKVRGTPTPENPALPDAPILASIKRTFLYHLGTLAFASLIIAIIDFIRAVVKYIEEQSRPKNGAQRNRAQACMFCMIQCCLSCIRCCCDKINKNALIWCAIWGTPLIPSICSSFGFIWANLLRVAAINMVSGYLLFIGKIMVATATTGVALLVFLKNDYYVNNLSSPVMPCVVIFILAFAIATIFMVIFECIIDTVFLCFLVDEKYNLNTPRMRAHKDLIELVGKHATESKAQGTQMKADADPASNAAPAAATAPTPAVSSSPLLRS